MKLYHATYKACLDRIMTNGLTIEADHKKAWTDSECSFIYLPSDPEAAISFAEKNKNVPKEWIDEIVLLEIDSEQLDMALIHLDYLVKDSSRLTAYQYTWDIPKSAVRESDYMKKRRACCLTCCHEFLNKCPHLKANEELKKIWDMLEKKTLPHMDAWLDEHKIKQATVCPEYRSKYIQYPLNVTNIEFLAKQPGDKRAGAMVKIRPCGDKKTYIGIFLGDLPISAHITHNDDSGVLSVQHVTNPAIFVPDLGKIIYGMESWWSRIETEADLSDITNVDIDSQWYIKALKDITK